MGRIRHRQYRILADHMDIYRFMTEIYETDWRNGVPAPFLEYALSSSWMSKEYTHRNRIWFDDDTIVAFCFTESPVTSIYFSLRPGYEALADEMVRYAKEHMPREKGAHEFVLFSGQQALINAAEKNGYCCAQRYVQNGFCFEKELDYPLPEGFSFVYGHELSVEKICECCWKGFDHEAEEGPWNGNAEDGYHLMQAPHFTGQHALAIADEKGEYACYAGMWWTMENRLAYMEPLCTIPKYRKKGLAAAILSEMYRQMKRLGATHMTGGADVFYEKIGFDMPVEWTIWKPACGREESK